jgi:hypothetical protein
MPPLEEGIAHARARLLSQLIWAVRLDGRCRRFTVKLDEVAIAQEHARLEGHDGVDDGADP